MSINYNPLGGRPKGPRKSEFANMPANKLDVCPHCHKQRVAYHYIYKTMCRSCGERYRKYLLYKERMQHNNSEATRRRLADVEYEYFNLVKRTGYVLPKGVTIA